MSVPEMKQDQKQGRKTIAHIVALKSRQRVTFAQTVVKKSSYIYRDLGVPKRGNQWNWLALAWLKETYPGHRGKRAP